LATSNELLASHQQRLLQIIGLLDAEVDTEVVAAALSTDTLAVSERQAARVLGELVDAGLLEVASPHADRWRLHDLIRLFARDKAREMRPAAREDAIRRALAVYLRGFGPTASYCRHRQHGLTQRPRPVHALRSTASSPPARPWSTGPQPLGSTC
jgi:hypothetical protein